MKNTFKRSLLLNTIILLIISILSLTIISTANSNYLATEQAITIKTVERTANLPVEEVLEPAAVITEPETVVEVPTEPKTVAEEKVETKKTTTKKTTKKTTKTETKTTTKTTTTPKKVETKKEETKQEEPKPTKTLKDTLAEKTKKYGIEVGNISISGSNFSKDLVKDDKSYYYLNNTLDKKKDNRGVPFIDYRHDFTGRKTIIYSHSAKDGKSPFNYLQNYNGNKDFYKKHQYITVVYGNKTYKYQIFSVYISTADSEQHPGLEYYRVMNYTDEEWGKKIQEYKDNSDYDTGVSVSKNDKILILQTCSMDNRYYKKYYRYNQLVMAKLISVKES